MSIRPEIRNQLELIVDQLGLAETLQHLASVCDLKSMHCRSASNGTTDGPTILQYQKLGSAWNRQALLIVCLASHPEMEG